MPGVAVGGVVAVVLEVEVRRRGHVVDLVAQRARLDVHLVLDAGHAVDDERVRAGDVDHDRRVDLGAVGQRHAGDAAVGAADLGHLGAEEELAALGLGGPLEVVGGQLRVVHVARPGGEDRAVELALRLVPEVRVVGALGRPEGVRAIDGDLLDERGVVPLLVLDAEVAVVAQDLLVVAGGALEQHGAALHVARGAHVVDVAEVALPVLPVEEALVGHRHALARGVVRAHDRARVARRPVAGARQLVDVQRLVAALAQLERGRRADDAGADDDRVSPASSSIMPADYKYICLQASGR